MSRREAISGTLFPSHYVADRLAADAAGSASSHDRARLRIGLRRVWDRAAATCGPATGLRALFDIVAMPLFGLLGFRATGVTFLDDHCRCTLLTREATPVVLLVLPWSTRPSGRWRAVTEAAREVQAAWAFLLNPPCLSLVQVAGFSSRRASDFWLPAVVADEAACNAFLTLTSARAFERQAPDGSTRLDRLVERALEFQARVRTDLQVGVETSLHALIAALRASGTGRSRRTDDRSETHVAHALALIYRVLFLLFAESRGLLLAGHPEFAGTYSMRTLCRESLEGEPRFGLWESLAAATRLSRRGCRTESGAIAPFNGRLFARASAPALESGRPVRRSTSRTRLREQALQATLVALGTRQGRAGRELVSYRDLGVEQLGAVYERILDLDRPDDAGSDGRRGDAPGPVARSGHSISRKRTGTFYTPQPLAEFVVRRTLAPLVAGASSDAILDLRVVDPAMGSGAFLVAACRYLARQYGLALVREGRLSAADLDPDTRARFRRLVAERCLAGVDRNPDAVQLARLSLWLTTLAHGKPLTFLDHRLRTGDSLLGIWPEDLSRMGTARTAQRSAMPLLDALTMEADIRAQSAPLNELLARHDETIDDVRAKEALWRQIDSATAPLAPWRAAASLWCARWFWPRDAGARPSASELRALIAALTKRDRTLTSAHVAARIAVATRIAAAERFFHWPLEFPDVFYDTSGTNRPGGFDAVLGNPPWEMVRRDDAAGGERRPLVRFVRESGLYRSCGQGHLNLYQPFLARSLALVRPGGRIGLILPWSLATDDGAAALRHQITQEASLDTLVGLDNRAGLFPIHRGLRFAVAVVAAGRQSDRSDVCFGVATGRELDALPDRGPVEIGTAGDCQLRIPTARLTALGGSTGRVPDLRAPDDLALLEHLTSRFPRLGDAASWSARFGRELNATEARASFGSEGLPVLEGKHLSPFQVDRSTSLRIARAEAARLLPDGRFDLARLAYRDVSGVGNVQPLIAAVLPPGVVTTHTVFCLRTPVARERQHFLCALFNSAVLNAVARLLMGGHVTTSLIESMPVPGWTGSDRERLIALLAEELAIRPSPRARGILEAHVARLYEIDAAVFDRLLGRSRLPAAVRDAAAQALRTLASADRRRTAPTRTAAAPPASTTRKPGDNHV